MTTFTHQLLSRKTSTPEVWQCESANIPAAVLRCPSLCCAWAMQKSFSFNQAEIDTKRRGAWQKLVTRHQVEMWPSQMVTATGRCSLSHHQKHKNLQRENLQFTEPHFVHRIARIWTRLTCHLGCSSADGLPSSKFLPSWQYEESNCQKHDRNYRMSQSLPIHQFYHLFICNYCYLPDGSTIFQGWFK